MQKCASFSGISYPTGVKSAQDHRHVIPTGVKYELNRGQGLPHRAKVCQKCWHNIPTGVKYELNRGQGFAYPAFSSPERWDVFAAPATV